MPRCNHQCLKKAHSIQEVYPMSVQRESLQSILLSIIETNRWSRATSEREQVIYTLQFCRDAGVNISQYELASFFGIERFTIQYHIKQGIDEIDPSICLRIGRPPILNEDEKRILIEHINYLYLNKYPATYQQIYEFCSDKFKKEIKLDTIRHIISNCNEVKVVTGIPMENDRALCDESKIDQYFSELEEALCFGIPPEFIVNIDETGFQEFVDSTNLQCIVPLMHNGSTVMLPRSRTTKRATLLAGICADGSTIKPLMVLIRDTIEQELLNNGYTPNVVMYGRSDTGFINSNLFIRWAKESFVPEMRERRMRYSYDGPILLLMDGFGIHDCDEFREILEAEEIYPLLFAPHSSDQTQFLDLLIFSLQKRDLQQLKIKNNFNWQTKQVMRILDSWKRVTTPKNVIASFRRGGIIVNWSHEKERLVAKLDRNHAVCVRHFQNNQQIDQIDTSKKRICIN